MRCENRRSCALLAVAGLGLLLGGCEANFTADLATDPPADPGITAVQVNLRGLEFRRSDGSTPTLKFNAGELVDLLDLRDGDPLRVFTDEQLPAGSYTGVRMLFDADEDDNAVEVGAAEFPLQLADGNFAEVDFRVEDEESSRESITLVLDLRQSLAFDEADDDYTLTPRLRAIRTGDAARIEGDVTVTCPTGTSLATGGAVYLFEGRDADPDDIDGAGVEPFATTAVVDDGFGAFGYALRFLPSGNYTIALTCRGDEDVVDESGGLDFRNVGNVQLDDDEVLQRNLD